MARIVRCSLIQAKNEVVPGLDGGGPSLAEMKQAMVRASQHVVLAVDSTKLSQRSAVRALSLDQIQTVVTELDPADSRLDPYREQVLLL